MVGTRVYVGGLNYRAGQRDLEKFFRGYGRLRDIVIKNGFGFVEFDDSRDADDAVYELNGKDLLGDRVVVELARSTLEGGRGGSWAGGYQSSSPGAGRGRPQWMDKVSVEKARAAPRSWAALPPPRPRMLRYGLPSRTDYRLVVENVSSRVSWQDLKDFMRQVGEVTYADAHKTRRNEGVVEFASSRDMRNALSKLDGKDLQGRRIKLFEENRHRRRSRSYSRSRSRSR